MRRNTGRARGGRVLAGSGELALGLRGRREGAVHCERNELQVWEVLLETRLAEFNLSYDKDIASVATDSGANVRRCCLDLTEEKKIDWVPCILHGLHNASKYALGLVDEDIADDTDDHEVVTRDIGTVEELFGNSADDGQ